uniref:Reverse transcriptase RNase H-like domain-containing protein n=1 Tax=Chelydra serpentina TaxID=8475 RepID=A0A8C3SF63_CHESE
VASGVLCQRSGPAWQPVGYYSKVLDPVAKGWPACLRAVTATALLVQEAEKLTLGGDTEVVVPHGIPQVSALQSVLLQLHRYAAPFQTLPLEQPVHSFQIGDQVLVKKMET